MRDVDLSNISDDEKEAFINTIEAMIDYGDGYCLSDDNIKLYDALIADRAKRNGDKKDEQNQTDMSPFRTLGKKNKIF